jgi:hypothetical protein
MELYWANNAQQIDLSAVFGEHCIDVAINRNGAQCEAKALFLFLQGF